MIPSPTILLLHEPGAPPSGLEDLAAALRASGAEVELRPSGEPYADVLDAVARADRVVYWR